MQKLCRTTSGQFPPFAMFATSQTPVSMRGSLQGRDSAEGLKKYCVMMSRVPAAMISSLTVVLSPAIFASAQTAECNAFTGSITPSDTLGPSARMKSSSSGITPTSAKRSEVSGANVIVLIDSIAISCIGNITNRRKQTRRRRETGKLGDAQYHPRFGLTPSRKAYDGVEHHNVEHTFSRMVELSSLMMSMSTSRSGWSNTLVMSARL